MLGLSITLLHSPFLSIGTLKNATKMIAGRPNFLPLLTMLYPVLSTVDLTVLWASMTAIKV